MNFPLPIDWNKSKYYFLLSWNINEFEKSVTGLKHFALKKFVSCDQISSHHKQFIFLLRPSFSTFLLVLALGFFPMTKRVTGLLSGVSQFPRLLIILESQKFGPDRCYFCNQLWIHHNWCSRKVMIFIQKIKFWNRENQSKIFFSL